MSIHLDLTEVAAKVIAALILAALAFLVPKAYQLLSAKIEEAKQLLGEKRFRQLSEIVRAAVLAAEQSGLVGEVKATGQDKKALAINYIQDQANAIGLKVDVGAVDALVEKTVLEQFNWGKTRDGGTVQINPQ